MGGILKKLKTVRKTGVDPILEGQKNMKKNIPEIEELARKRLRNCRECLEPEQISFLKVKDKRIEELSEMMCRECGCAAPWLYRQSVKKCEKWEE